jgi:hypothetical protein
MEQGDLYMTTNNNNKKDYCIRKAFENLRKTKYQPNLKKC